MKSSQPVDGAVAASTPSFRQSAGDSEPPEAEDQDDGDVEQGVDEDALERDDLDIDRVAWDETQA